MSDTPPPLVLGSPTKRARLEINAGVHADRTPAGVHETPEEELARLRRENEQLRVELESLQAVVTYVHSPKLGATAPSHLRTKSTMLPGGKEVRISNLEMAAMRAIFDLFDLTGTGTISATELQRLHEKLGEPITDDEAHHAVADIGRGRDHITFEDFALYWDGTHPSQRPSTTKGAESFSDDSFDEAERGRKRTWYQARFKFMKAKMMNPAVGRIYTIPDGAFPSLEYRVRFYVDDETGARQQISPWHDVPFRNPDGTYNMIVEIPKWTRRKFEIATGEPFNPIKQDVKNGVLREYGYGDMLFNYGCIPQTWENPSVKHPATGCIGDNDPIDIVDVGAKQWTPGSIVAVKILGVIAMIDSGETDWKLIAINVEDPLAPLLNDIEDLNVHMPGAAESLHHWLKHYKTPVLNEFAFDGVTQNRAFAETVIDETHHEWKRLIEERGSAAVVPK